MVDIHQISLQAAATVSKCYSSTDSKKRLISELKKYIHLRYFPLKLYNTDKVRDKNMHQQEFICKHQEDVPLYSNMARNIRQIRIILLYKNDNVCKCLCPEAVVSTTRSGHTQGFARHI